EAIARRSTLIGTPNPVQMGAICSAHGKTVRCADVVADSGIAGILPPGPIRVHTLFGGFDSYPQVLLMLRGDGSGGYETVGFGAGTFPVVGDRIETLGLGVREFVRTIRLAIASGAAEGSKP